MSPPIHSPDAADRGVRSFAALGAVFGLIGVLVGAFGAHGARAFLTPERLAVLETGARYQDLHALALLACAWALQSWPGRLVWAAGVCFAAGILLFSGSLYLLAWSGNPRFGALTPLGGLGFMAGWLLLAVGLVNPKRSSK